MPTKLTKEYAQGLFLISEGPFCFNAPSKGWVSYFEENNLELSITKRGMHFLLPNQYVSLDSISEKDAKNISNAFYQSESIKKAAPHVPTSILFNLYCCISQVNPAEATHALEKANKKPAL